jgi:hypothetical protein
LTPRTNLTGTKHVGWKYQVVDHKDNYIQLFWFPKQAAILFGKLWRNYCRYLTPVDRQHPYAFISFEESHAGKLLMHLRMLIKKLCIALVKLLQKLKG